MTSEYFSTAATYHAIREARQDILADAPERKKPSALRVAFFNAVLAAAAVGGLFGGHALRGQHQVEQAQEIKMTAFVRNLDSVRVIGVHEADARAPRMDAYDRDSYNNIVRIENSYFTDQYVYFSRNEVSFLRNVDSGNVAQVRDILKSAPSVLNNTGRLAMVLAAKNGDLDMINMLHAAGLGVNAVYHAKGYVRDVPFSPLGEAAERGMVKTVELLLSMKADPNLVADSSPLYRASSAYYDEEVALAIMSMLVKAGANVSGGSENSPFDALYAAASHRSEKKLAFLLDHDLGAANSINNSYRQYTYSKGSTQGLTLLMVAIDSYGYDRQPISPAVKLLIDRGADLTAKDEDGWTALHYAAALDQIDLVKYLIHQKGMDPREKTANGMTALDVAKAVFPHPINAIDYLGNLSKAKTRRLAVVAP
jgi:ankyrin repeat protein